MKRRLRISVAVLIAASSMAVASAANVANDYQLQAQPVADGVYVFSGRNEHFSRDNGGNIVNTGWPEHWIRTLGKRILKLDIKEYSRKMRDQSGPYAGFKAELGEGDCDWPAVLKALDDIGYTGWGTAEVAGGDRERLADISRRMDKILH